MGTSLNRLTNQLFRISFKNENWLAFKLTKVGNNMNQRLNRFKPRHFIAMMLLFVLAGWMFSSAILMLAWNAFAPAVTFINGISFGQAMLLSIVFFVMGRLFNGPSHYFNKRFLFKKMNYSQNHCPNS